MRGPSRLPGRHFDGFVYGKTTYAPVRLAAEILG